MTSYIYGDPMRLAAELERQERDREKFLAGTGCDNCQHAVTAWDITVCGIGEKHPRCVFRGRYIERDSE